MVIRSLPINQQRNQQAVDDKLKKFCEHYEVKVVDTQGRYARYRRNAFFVDPERADMVESHVEQLTEPLYTIQIPESRLKTLIEMEERFMGFRPTENVRDMFDLLMEKEREESFYRNTNEAVRNAYKTYSTMLHLAGYVKKV